MKIQLFAFLLAFMVSIAHAEWTPPEKPDPAVILDEAGDDAEAGNFEDALAKYVWFYQNALKHSRSFYGVRLSFALTAWVRLAEIYPPAAEKLKAIRDEAGETARKGGEGAVQAFHDFQSINETLADETKTKDLFVWLHHNKPDLAKKVFPLAQPDLVKAKEYKLAGDYIDPVKDFERLFIDYKNLSAQAEKPEAGERVKTFAEKKFSNGITTLVALLVVNDRKTEAAQVATLATKAWESKDLVESLKKAWEGTVPDPWP